MLADGEADLAEGEGGGHALTNVGVSVARRMNGRMWLMPRLSDDGVRLAELLSECHWMLSRRAFDED